MYDNPYLKHEITQFIVYNIIIIMYVLKNLQNFT